MLNLIKRLFQKGRTQYEPGECVRRLFSGYVFVPTEDGGTKLARPCFDDLRADTLAAENLRIVELSTDNTETVVLYADDRVIEVDG